ncbi:MAG: (2Fe-2S)-binding protein [Halanaerobium sp.]|nr:(2Fe-2S)-binding protein [Halanaerobium sp.]
MNLLKVTLTVNGERRTLEVKARTRLIDLLRDGLRMTGTKEGCGKGECGACSVIMDGKLVPSCLILAKQADGTSIITSEGLNRDGQLHPIQKAFIESGAIQCGFCTPGMVLAALALLAENPRPSREEIRKGLAGNICRCTGYEKIIAAIELAAERINSGEEELGLALLNLFGREGAEPT